MRWIVFLGGAAALAWQIVWSHHLALALGASSKGVALTVATAMAGMTLGALACARYLRKGTRLDPVLLYGLLELATGLGALIPGVAESGIMALDGSIHRQWPRAATPFTVLALAASIGPACLAMGATLPVMGLISRSLGRPLSRLYACNTAGAAAGPLLAAFLLIPSMGLRGASHALVLAHLGIAAACGILAARRRRFAREGVPSRPEIPGDSGGADPAPPARTTHASALALLTGAAAFLLEVAWFRSLRSAWFSTADSVAIMLFCFLVALSLGAAAAPWWRRRGFPLWAALAGAATLVLLATPLIGRFDLVDAFQSKGAWRQASRLLAGLAVIGPPVVLLGIPLPGLLDEGRRPRDWAVLYAVNTLGAVAGANAAAWILLGAIGPSGTAWVAAGLLAFGAWIATPSPKPRALAAAAFLTILAGVLWFERDGRDRVPRTVSGTRGLELVERRHGPDATLSVVASPGGRALFINGFAATAEARGPGDDRLRYMDAMGRVPMLLHPAPRSALVICFGTGQTAHAVRDEGPERLDLVDLNGSVFDLARHFDSNHGVLADPRSRSVTMDGRAWLRRTEARYDVVTLEPMPPFFSGSNALYSVEFYRLVSARLNPGGFLAQWFPLHLMTPEQARSIAAAFVEVFPDSILWMDPHSAAIAGLPEQGILVGKQGGGTAAPTRYWEEWPGSARKPESGERGLAAFEARRQVLLDPAALRRFAAGAEPVTDDNQRLEYGDSPYRRPVRVAESIRAIHDLLGKAGDGP